VLEVLNAAALGKDGLTAVTLNLNGGTLGTTKSAADIKIICAGETYTAPSAAGIARPDGNGSYFMWNTKQDGSGTDYAPGDTVPKSVTALYAQWTVTKEQITTLPVGNTYYFDLSGLKSYNNLGTVNTANPDTTWHYVPFTFDGTVYAYSLNAAAKGDNTATAAASGTTAADAVKGHTYAHSLFTGNYLLTTGVTGIISTPRDLYTERLIRTGSTAFAPSAAASAPLSASTTSSTPSVRRRRTTPCSVPGRKLGLYPGQHRYRNRHGT
jgi:hypothetical protein